jgi:hypothetical protein
LATGGPAGNERWEGSKPGQGTRRGGGFELEENFPKFKWAAGARWQATHEGKALGAGQSPELPARGLESSAIWANWEAGELPSGQGSTQSERGSQMRQSAVRALGKAKRPLLAACTGVTCRKPNSYQ